MACFIVFEGGDDSGKSTQSRVLYRRLQRQGNPTLLTREPGGTPSGEVIRRLLKNHQDISSLSELLLFVAARAELVESVIEPALGNGTIVISDRYTASTVAYQGYGRGLDLALIQELNLLAGRGLTPDLTVLLDLPVSVALDRRANRVADTFEAAPPEFHHRVRDGYLAQAAADPQKWLVLDATGSRQQLGREIWAKVQPLL